MQQPLQTLWVNEEENIISFHKEEAYEEKTFESQEDFDAYVLIHGRCGYKFK